MRLVNLFKYIYLRLISANKVAKVLGVKYGNNCHFGTKNFGSEPYLIEIGDNFKTSYGVQFITHDGAVHVLRNKFDELKDIDLFAKIIIGNNVFLGLNSIILQGTIIGNDVIIGAGSVVKGNIESNGVYAGVPAKFICTIEEYLNKNNEHFVNTKHLNLSDKAKFIKFRFEVI